MKNKTTAQIKLKVFITKILKFEYKRTSSFHEMYEGDFKGLIRNVTLDMNHDKFSSRIQKNNFSSMIKQMGFNNKKEFFKFYDSKK